MHDRAEKNTARALRRKTAWRGCLVALSIAAMSAMVAAAQSPTPPGPPAQNDGLQLQELRNKFVAERGNKRYYAETVFDLSDLPQYVPQQKVSGLIRMWGLNYIADSPLLKYWENGFKKYNPDVTFEYHMPTALASTSALVTGVGDIGANRKMTFTEYLQFERLFGYDPLEVPLATGSLDTAGWSDAMCIFVNKDNPLTKLTKSQLDGIFGSAREGGWVGTAWHRELARGADRNLRTWGDLGLTGEWKDKVIEPWGPVIRYDTATKFSDAILRSSDDWNERTHMVANYDLGDGTFYIWEKQVTDAVAKDKYAIGYGGHGFLNPQVKALPIQFEENGPFVAPSLQSLHDRTYQLFQANYWYVNRPPGTPLDPRVKEYLRYVLSREGQQEVIHDGKYLPLNRQLVTKALASLE